MKLSFKRSTKENNPNSNTNLEWQIADFNYNAKYCSQKIADFVLKKREYMNVYPNIKPGYLRSLLPATAPDNPQTFKTIIDDFFSYILPATAHWNHTKFVGYFPSGNAFANIYGDMLSTAFGGVGFSWTAQPSLSELENVMMDWFSRSLNLPSQFVFGDSKGVGGGCTHNTSSDAIYTTIVAARHIPLKAAGCYPDLDNPHHLKSDAPHPGIILEKLVAYTSYDAHSCVEKGCRLALCTLHILRPHYTTSGLQGSTLEDQILIDLKKKLIPFYCCATLGTPNICAYDDLKTIGPVCQKYKIYLHVDAAYAGNAFMLNDCSRLREGLEYADSINVNPYKLMLGAIDLACLFLKNVKDYKAPFFIDATYLLDEFANETDKEIKRNEIDYRHYGIALSRRMRSLKLYFLFRMKGLNAIKQYIQNIRKWAKKLEELVNQDKRFEVVNTVHLGLVVFRQKTRLTRNEEDHEHDAIDTDDYFTFSDTDKKNLNLLLRLNKSRELHLIPCICRFLYCLRVSINYEHYTLDIINQMWKTIQKYYVDELDTSLVEFFKRSPKMTSREASRLSFSHLLEEEDYPEFKERQKDPATCTIPLTFGPIFVPPASKSAAKKKETNQPLSETRTRKSEESGTKLQGASKYMSDEDDDDYDYDDGDDDDDDDY